MYVVILVSLGSPELCADQSSGGSLQDVALRHGCLVKTSGIAGCALGSNMTAICSDTSVYVGVTIFPLVRSCRLIVPRLPGFCQPLESDL